MLIMLQKKVFGGVVLIKTAFKKKYLQMFIENLLILYIIHMNKMIVC